MLNPEQMTEIMPAMRKQAMRLTRNADAAEDLTQDACLRAIEKRDKFESGTNARAWAVTLMTRLHISRCRKYKREDVVDPEEEVLVRQDFANQDDYVGLREVEEKLNDMPNAHKNAILHVCRDGLTLDQAANEENVSPGTLRSRLARARTSLREINQAAA